MAEEAALELFIGKDHEFTPCTLYTTPAKTAIQDQTGFAESFMVKRKRHHADAAAVLTKTTVGGSITISGSYHSDPSTNTQKATIAIRDTDTTSLNPGLYYWEWARTDDGFETVLAFGTLHLKRSVHD